MSIEDSNLLLVPPASAPPAVPAVERTCNECGQPVWVSIALAPAADAGGVRPWCFTCAAASGRVLHPKQHPEQASDGQGVGEFDQMASRVLDRVRAARAGVEMAEDMLAENATVHTVAGRTGMTVQQVRDLKADIDAGRAAS